MRLMALATALSAIAIITPAEAQTAYGAAGGVQTVRGGYGSSRAIGPIGFGPGWGEGYGGNAPPVVVRNPYPRYVGYPAWYGGYAPVGYYDGATYRPASGGIAPSPVAPPAVYMIGRGGRAQAIRTPAPQSAPQLIVIGP